MSELAAQVRRAVLEAFPERVWVRAEVRSQKQTGSGYFLELVDGEAGEAQRAQAIAVERQARRRAREVPTEHGERSSGLTFLDCGATRMDPSSRIRRTPLHSALPVR